MLTLELDDIFSESGPLAEEVKHYHLRNSQLELARSIAKAISDDEILIAEAGTGTGKSWAYLVPAFLSGGKVLVSTGTRTLQDQLFRRDLPHLRKALSLSLQIALLKGRSNYVCHYRLERAEHDGRGFSSRREAEYLHEINRFISQTSTGDKVDLASVPEDAEIWSRVTSTRDNSVGQDWRVVSDSFV